MSRTQTERQQAFKERLQAEGADSFADGPRPWEQWDESGNQGDNRVWEGTARRIYPKRKAVRSFGDRLLSGLAVVALGSMLVGIAGVFLSTPSTPRQARSTIQPPPIFARRTTAPAATTPTEPAATTTPVIAQLETLAPPAAGIPAPPSKPQTILEPTLATARRTPSPVIQADSVDRVAVETVITEGAVTTRVFTRQPSQDEPEMIAMIATTAPPFTHAAAQHEEAPVATATETVLPGQNEAAAMAAVVVAPAEIGEVTAPVVVEQATETISEPAIVALTETAPTEPDVAEQATETITEPAVITLAETAPTEPDVAEQATETITEPAIVALAEQDVAGQATKTITEPAVITLADTAPTEPDVAGQATETITEPAVITLAETAPTDPDAAEQKSAVMSAPSTTEQGGAAATEPAVDEQTAAVLTAPDIVAQTGPLDSDIAVIEETTQPAAAAVALNTPATAAETTPDITRALETATQTPVLPAAKTGKWVINLSSYTRKSTAERMLAVFQQKGVDAEVFATTINDKPMYRIRVTGFEHARSARAEISTLEQQLDLEGAWISKR